MVRQGTVMRPSSFVAGATLVGSLVCLLQGACNPSNAASAEPRAVGGESFAGRLATFPQDVLVGTDVQPLKSLLASRAPVSVPSDLANEQGGGNATIHFQTANGGVDLTRVFREPGATASKKSYTGLKPTEDPAWLSGPGIEVLGLKWGVLVLEKSSGTDAIPSTLWLLYERSSKRKARKR